MNVPARRISAHPNLDQLKRQAKDLVRAFHAGDPVALAEVHAHYRGADSTTFALHHAQLVLARAYGFASWPRLKAFVESLTGTSRLIKPVEFESTQSSWDTIVAASTGDSEMLRKLLERDSQLARASYWYAPAIHFAARGGHLDAVRLLLDAGADPEGNGLNDRNLIEMARERGHEQVAQLLEQARERRGRVAPRAVNQPIHRAAALGDIKTLRELLDTDATLVNCGGRRGMTPLDCAVLCRSHPAVELLLDRGANIHALSSDDLQAIDFAVWGEERQAPDPEMTRLLVSRGATYDLTIAAALGDLASVRQMLDDNPSRIRETRPNRRRPLSAAVEFDDKIARFLLERGADPRWEPADVVHRSTMKENFAMLKLLLEHGADPNEEIDSMSYAIVFATTPEIRALLESYGGGVGRYDTSWIEHDDERLRQVAADPSDTALIGAAFTMSADRPDLLTRLLDAGLRMPTVHTTCQGYLVKPDALRTLLQHGMSPDQMNWQHQTLLHHASTRDSTECAEILLDAGASLTVRDDDYRSTPLAWAARANKPQMVEFLLSRGAPIHLPDDEPWATPLSWAERRGHQRVASILRAHGATR
jgi:ankyrin repeat protein